MRTTWAIETDGKRLDDVCNGRAVPAWDSFIEHGRLGLLYPEHGKQGLCSKLEAHLSKTIAEDRTLSWAGLSLCMLDQSTVCL